MASAPRSTDLCNSLPPATPGNGDRDATARPHSPKPVDVARRRLNRELGALIGGLIFLGGGCLLGASMPYEHPVGVAVSILWWGIYAGCFGLCVGALLGLWADSTPPSPPPGAMEGNGAPAEAGDQTPPPVMGRSLVLPPTKWPRHVPMPLEIRLLVNRKG
jgi:hypothetical protein